MPSCFSCLVPRATQKPTNAVENEKPTETKNEKPKEDSHILRVPCPPIPQLPPKASFGAFILQKISAEPDFVAQVNMMNDKEDTYRELKDRSVKTALWLRSRGISPGDVVAVCSHVDNETCIPVFAALYCAAISAPWDADMNTKDLKHMARLSTPKFVFCSEQIACTVLVALQETNCKAEVVVFGQHHGCKSYAEILELYTPEEIESFKCTELEGSEDVALIVGSSGSTGMPKCVEHTHRSILLQMGIAKYLNVDRMTCSVFSSIYWISGLVGMFLCIACNMKKVLVPVKDEEMCCKAIEMYKVNWALMGTSVLLRLIYSGYLGKYDMTSLKKISGGGGLVTAEAYGKLRDVLPNADVILGYGMTELGGAATIQDMSTKPGSCGRPAMGVACKVIDTQTGKVLGPNETGEICWQSPCLMKGYRGNPKETDMAIDKDKWLHSGDIGYFDTDGNVFIVDRMKELIKYRGNQISPAELESIIKMHPGVKECVVVGKPHKVDVEHPVAFVLKKKGAVVTEKDIVDMVAEEVIERKRLRGGVRFVDAFSLTPSGKPKRAELRELIKKEAE